MWAHEDVAGVQRALQKVLLGLGDVDPSQRSFWQCVGWHQSKAVNTHLVNAVNCLERGEMVTDIPGTATLQDKPLDL